MFTFYGIHSLGNTFNYITRVAVIKVIVDPLSWVEVRIHQFLVVATPFQLLHKHNIVH